MHGDRVSPGEGRAGSAVACACLQRVLLRYELNSCCRRGWVGGVARSSTCHESSIMHMTQNCRGPADAGAIFQAVTNWHACNVQLVCLTMCHACTCAHQYTARQFPALRTISKSSLPCLHTNNALNVHPQTPINPRLHVLLPLLNAVWRVAAQRTTPQSPLPCAHTPHVNQNRVRPCRHIIRRTPKQHAAHQWQGGRQGVLC